MNSFLTVAFVALATLQLISVNAAPTPAPKEYISYGALGKDRVPGSGGATSQANPYNRG
jgi:Rapid ALkalinization Factor (RALF)